MNHLLIFLAILTTSVAYAQPLSTFPEQPYTTFSDMDISGDHIVALGTCEMLGFSTDGGVTWTYQPIEGSSYTVRFMPGYTDRVIVGQYRGMKVYHRDEGLIKDFGDQEDIKWHVQQNIEIYDGSIYYTNQMGLTRMDPDTYERELLWQDTTEADIVHAMDLTDNYFYMGFRHGRFMRYDLRTGAMEHRNDLGGWIQRLDMYSDQGGYLINNNNQKILKTIDGGLTFVELPNMSERIQPVAYGADILLTVNTNRIYLSEDGGESQEYVETANTPEFGNISKAVFTEDGTLYMCGRASTMVKSTDFGRTFTVLNPQMRADFIAMDVGPDGIGYAGGVHGVIYRTDDHGYTWSPVTSPVAADVYMDEIEYLGNNEYHLLAGDKLFHMRGDVVLSATPFEGQRIITVAQGDYQLSTVWNTGSYDLIKSTNNGQSWTIVLSELSSPSALSVDRDGNIWAIVDQNRLQRSTDAGLSWEEKTLSFDTYLINFYDGLRGLCSAGNKIYLTKDGGDTFEEVYSLYGLRNMLFYTADHMVFTSSTQAETTLFESMDGGETWNRIYNNCSITGAAALNAEGAVVLAQQGGHINTVPLSMSVPTSTTAVGHTPPSPLYPNPVTGGGSIQVAGQWTSMQIYNLQGSLVANYAANQSAISTADLPSGCYIVHLQVDGVAEVHKLLVQ